MGRMQKSCWGQGLTGSANGPGVFPSYCGTPPQCHSTRVARAVHSRIAAIRASGGEGLGQVHSGAGGLHRSSHIFLLVHRQADDFDARHLLGYSPSRFHPAHSRHRHIHQDYVRLDLQGCLNGLLAVGGLSHDLDVRFHLEQPRQACPYDLVVIDQQDADDILVLWLALSSLPDGILFCGYPAVWRFDGDTALKRGAWRRQADPSASARSALSISIEPPMSSRRSRMLKRPNPVPNALLAASAAFWAQSTPTPSSATRIRIWSGPIRLMVTPARSTPACLATFSSSSRMAWKIRIRISGLRRSAASSASTGHG